MIPYFEQPRLHLGPLTIHAFGALVATGVLLGTELLKWRAKRLDLDVMLAVRFLTWVLVGGFIGAHLVHCFVYFPEQTLQNPLSIFKIWDGLSSFGGFLGAVVGAVWFIKRGYLGDKVWSYLDLVIYAFPLGWLFGRTGCFVAFDHPGSRTDFFLGMNHPERGGVIHNLGLYEAVYTAFMLALVLWLGRKPRFPGFFVGVLCIVYAPVRFLLDFLRQVDVRYGGLTPGQWGSIALLFTGVYILVRKSKAARATTASPIAPAGARVARG